MAGLDIVTGAFSYTGRHIAEALLERGHEVRTLSRRPAPAAHPLAGQVETAPLVFDDSLAASLRGADTLYNTYWVRFERGATTFERAVESTSALLEAARHAGVRRIVHVSVANASADSPFPYFRGKARTEEALRECGLSYAIVRPTLIFGPEDVLLNNIAWALRHLPVFLVAGDGRYDVQPVSAPDTARICVDAGERADDVVVDAAGPERLSYEALVRLIARATRARARVVHVPPRVALAVARLAGMLLRDVVVTKEELDGLRAGLLVSEEPPRGTDHIGPWLEQNGAELGRSYTSELARNFR